ncbi:hypothetical protein D3C72_2359850 [compost metagenome]
MKPMSTGFCWALAAYEANDSMTAAAPRMVLLFMVVSSCAYVRLPPGWRQTGFSRDFNYVATPPARQFSTFQPYSHCNAS